MMHYDLQISKAFLDCLHNHAETHHPLETVALFFGEISNTSVCVNRIELMENKSTTKHTTFSVDPEEEYQLLVEAEERGESLVGIFHSHPAPPEPSQTDLRNMRLNPVVWLIASKQSESWISRAFILENDTAIEITIKCTDAIDADS
jgi:proteasome lid subunit RPN8/RPN11